VPQRKDIAREEGPTLSKLRKGKATQEGAADFQVGSRVKRYCITKSDPPALTWNLQ
jgi:hypothetical protein